MRYEDCKVGDGVRVNENVRLQDLVNHIGIINQIDEYHRGNFSIRIKFIGVLPGIPLANLVKEFIKIDSDFGLRPDSLDFYELTNRTCTIYLKKE